MPTIAVTIVDQTVAVTQVGEIGPTGATGATGATGSISGAPDGTAGAPGIAFASDADTGFFRPGANILAAATAGTERWRVGQNFQIVSTGKLHFTNEQGVGPGGDGISLNMFGSVFGGAINFFTGAAGTTQAATILENGNVGIGTTEPVGKLEIYTYAVATLQGGANIRLTRDYAGSTYGSAIYTGWNSQGMDTLVFGVAMDANPLGAGKERMVITTFGNVGIGTTAPGDKLEVYGGGVLINNVANTTLATHLGIGGTVRAFFEYSDPGGMLRMGTTLAQSVGIDTENTRRVTVEASGHVTPGADNTQNFGSGSLRWNTIYAGSGTINTSDERYKVIREGGDLTEAEFAAWSDVRAIVYRDKYSFDRKGDAARLHVGYSWQAIQAAFDAQGLDPAKYGLWCEDELSAPVTKTRTAQRQIEGQTEIIPVLDEAGEPVFEQVQATEEVEQPFEEVRIVDGAPVLVKGTRTTQQPLFDSVQIKDEDGEPLFETVQERDAETGELLFDTNPALDDDGEPILDKVQATDSETGELLFDSEVLTDRVPATEEVKYPFEEVQIIKGAPVLVKGVRTTQQPLYDSAQVVDEAGELVFDTDPETDEPTPRMMTVPRMVDVSRIVETPRMVEVPRMIQTPRMGPAPRMASVPRMVSKAKTETVPVMEDYEETYTEMEPTGETRGALRYQECAVLEAAWLRRELAQVIARVAVLEAA